jgi:hypothetical protein
LGIYDPLFTTLSAEPFGLLRAHPFFILVPIACYATRIEQKLFSRLC